MPHPDGHAVIETVAGENADDYAGMTLDRRRSKTGRVLERRRTERVDSLIDDPEVDQIAARRMGARTGATPLSFPTMAGVWSVSSAGAFVADPPIRCGFSRIGGRA